MKKQFLILLYLLSCAGAFAQSDKNVEQHQFTVNALLPGVVYEAGISDNATLTAELTFGFAYRESVIFEEGYGVYPIGRFQYRHYYNFDRRLRKGKRISGNTGNYLAPTLAFQSGRALFGNLDLASNVAGGIGVVYGLQRTAPKGFQFRLEAGPAYYKDNFDQGLTIFLAAKLGWVI